MDNRQDRNRRTNVKDRDGKIKLCRGCKSPWLLIRNCPQATKATLISLVLDQPVPNLDFLATSTVMDLLQDLPYDVWRANIPSTETTHPLPNETSRAMYNRLVTITDQHGIIKSNVHNSTWTSLLTSVNPNSHVFLQNRSTLLVCRLTK